MAAPCCRIVTWYFLPALQIDSANTCCRIWRYNHLKAMGIAQMAQPANCRIL
ncbi:MAG: hypothetical protein HDT11_00500 [Helicobacter sp.]|nr:hypothetical protein [Helicobacter sp.]